ncbi:histidine kinase [Photobacterium jeanii]|uniref:Histidine kinase n=1 Tax=Photobacterium jeanii TaxID=858640 RepID=A0A178KN30_9GAMM|nr:EAL domain-containing response regulator [Photobacterium jeanii]OAN18651.1 histidine kinase [Photobacterium jeanii]PST91669.1 hypothetical protein C9I91_00340 [Photobacterium jeanii]
MKVLLIEDHAFQRQVMVTQLNHLLTGIEDEIQTAYSGKNALDILTHYHADLLLCDLNMPEMDGISFLRAMAEKKFTGGVIITSATSYDVLRSVSKMCTTYKLNLLGALSKPVQLSTLAELLQNARELRAHPSSIPAKSLPRDLVCRSMLDQAFQQQWLQPFFQPIVDLKTGQWIGSEALIRLNHPEAGLLSPSTFMPQLCEQNLDTELTLYILGYILKHQPCFDDTRIAINITSGTLSSPTFVDQVLQLAQTYTGLPEQVYFELTESDMVKDTGRALEAASRLGLHGFTLSIDDFGTGFSSLKQLETLPFESLKIDMGFVRAIETSNTAFAIVESCLFLCRRLELTAIAEGIETHHQWHTLQTLNCHRAQGYFIAPPMPATKLNQWHKEWQQKVTQLQV